MTAEISMSLHVGSITGIPVKLHYTWFFAFFLIATSLAVGYLPAQFPQLSTTAYWIIGAISAVALFASVLVHELAHSWVAMRNGVGIVRIVLFIFGGVAQMTDEPHSPRVEFKIASAGPLASFGIALLAIGIGSVVPQQGSSLYLFAVLQYTGLINLLLGGFNLIPAFPLDGGRMFRAGVWRLFQDKVRATRIASGVGSGFAIILILVGLVFVFRGSLITGIWLAFIGWFLKNATESTLSHTILSKALENARVGDVMSSTVHTIAPELTIREVVDNYLLVFKHVGYPVVSSDRLLGILTLQDVKKVPRDQWQTTRVEDVMTKRESLVTVAPDDDAARALVLLSQKNVGRLPVISDGKLVGILSRSDITRLVSLRGVLGAEAKKTPLY